MAPDYEAPPVELLRVTDLHAFYGESHILHGMDFRVQRGELVTLLGRNGSGRTTTLKAILGLTSRRTGSVMMNGRETIHMPPHQIVHLGIGYCPEERGIFASLSAEENLMLLPAVGSGGRERGNEGTTGLAIAGTGDAGATSPASLVIAGATAVGVAEGRGWSTAGTGAVTAAN